MERGGVTGKSGKQYLAECGKIGECAGCPFLRSCWNEEEFRRLTGRPPAGDSMQAPIEEPEKKPT